MTSPAGNDLPLFDLTRTIIGGFYDVYNQLGLGFLESVYERSLTIALSEAGLRVEQQFPTTVFYRDKSVGFFRADLLVENQIIVEIKVARRLHTKHVAQLINVLKATSLEVGLLLNFGRSANFKRVVYTKEKGPLSPHRINPRQSAGIRDNPR
jgi:GxxExxY protein